MLSLLVYLTVVFSINGNMSSYLQAMCFCLICDTYYYIYQVQQPNIFVKSVSYLFILLNSTKNYQLILFKFRINNLFFCDLLVKIGGQNNTIVLIPFWGVSLPPRFQFVFLIKYPLFVYNMVGLDLVLTKILTSGSIFTTSVYVALQRFHN